MITHTRAADFEMASHRARQRWAENIDQLLAAGPVAGASALREARDILLDPRVEVRSSDLHELLRVIRDDGTATVTSEELHAFVACYRPSA